MLNQNSYVKTRCSQNNEIHNLIISEKLFGSPMKFCHFNVTSVACAVGPNVITSLTDFSFQNLVFGIYLNFQSQKWLKNQYLPHSESKSYRINSIKSCSSRSFQQHQRHIPIPSKISAMILFNFQWKNHSIFKNFCTASPNTMKPSPCTPPPRELINKTKNVVWSILAWWIS